MEFVTHSKFTNIAAAFIGLSSAMLFTVSAHASEATFTSAECDKIVGVFTDQIVPKSKSGIEPFRDFAESVVYYGSLDCPTSYEFYARTPESIEIFTTVKTQILEAKLDASNLLATDKPPK